jgi:hypothetical protein
MGANTQLVPLLPARFSLTFFMPPYLLRAADESSILASPIPAHARRNSSFAYWAMSTPHYFSDGQRFAHLRERHDFYDLPCPQ